MTLLIVEGVDGAGKTTLIEAIAKRYRWADVRHHGAYPGETAIARHYLRSAYEALRHPNKLVVMDRSWLAEPVYGLVMRDGANRVPAWQRRMLERVALGAGAVVVHCHPSLDACRRAWESRLHREYPQKAEQLAQLHDLYGVARPGWAAVFPVLEYDYTSDDRARFLDLVDEALLARRGNGDPTIGAPVQDRPWLLIGDRPGHPNPHALPFVSIVASDTRLGCSAWLADQLESWGVSERRLAWANQSEVDGSQFEAFDRYRGVIALGGYALGWCETNDVSAAATFHPQYWKRFHHHEPYPLKELLA